MPRRLALLTVVSVPLVALTSCSTNSGFLAKGPRLLSSDAAHRIAGSGSSFSDYNRRLASMPFNPAAPSAQVRADVSRRPRDRHGMPVYAGAERNRYVRTTAYTHTETDHLQYGVLSAAGTPLRFNQRSRSAAADWSVYPVGTVFKIKGLPYYYVVDDYGSALVGTQTVDLFMPNDAWMRAWGSRMVEVSVVKWGSFESSAEMLSKRFSYPHCRQMYAAIVRRNPQYAQVAQANHRPEG